ncbi:MAG TPA: hypothetical protein VGE08_00540 [Steroidobacter sp.]|uniref:hypothetical protein n=1 Tax=Steroidobacter sp. TaxID=1978227 RepID=UPI002EDAC161
MIAPFRDSRDQQAVPGFQQGHRRHQRPWRPVRQGRWHRASFGGTGMATRLAINPRPEGMHDFQPPEND